MTAKAIRKWRNVRNNDIIEEEGRVSFSWANDAKHEISGRGVEPQSPGLRRRAMMFGRDPKYAARSRASRGWTA